MGFLNFLTQHIRWNIRRHHVVLDIGSGNNPILRADILVDKYIHSDKERYSRIIVDRPIICADAQHLPFKNKSVDFIYCSHVLEHVSEPESMLREFERVSQRGLIVTPHGDYEKIDPRKMHLWYIWNKSNKLIIKQKHRWDEYPDISRYFYKITCSRRYRHFSSRNYSLFNTTYFWADKIRYEVTRDHPFDYSRFEMAQQPDGQQVKINHSVPARLLMKSIVGRFIRPIVSSRSF